MEPPEGFEGECCWKGCHEAVTDVDVISGHEYPHCRKHHQRFQGVIEKLMDEIAGVDRLIALAEERGL